MRATRTVTVIPPTVQRHTLSSVATRGRKRVAAYARVSTDNEEQLSSYEAQVDYYTRYIQSKEGWEFIEIYTDEGISATSTKKRDGFKRMIADALAGKIDLILTKSVSRFARNTVDTLTTVRQLKEKGVEVYFEKENIYTLDSKGELLITIMSSLAQEESRSISENTTWGQRKRFADGKVSMPYKHFLGYTKGEDGLPKIVEKEAEVVRSIYKQFLEGKTPAGIAKQLTDNHIPTPAGKEKWQPSTVESILTNEKYKGDAILQKRFTVDFLTKKQKINGGEVPQYYVENSHPAIISSEVFDLAQEEIKRRKGSGGHYSGINCFSGKIICGECGGFYGSKVWHSTSKYRRVIWQCNNKFRNEKKCTTPHLYEEDIQKAFVEAFNKLIQNKEEIIQGLEQILAELMDTTALDNEIKVLQVECDSIMTEMRGCILVNAQTEVDQVEYSDLTQKYESAQGRLEKAEAQRQERVTRQDEISVFFNIIFGNGKLLTEFDHSLWNAVVEALVVCDSGRWVFKYKDGSSQNRMS